VFVRSYGNVFDVIIWKILSSGTCNVFFIQTVYVCVAVGSCVVFGQSTSTSACANTHTHTHTHTQLCCSNRNLNVWVCRTKSLISRVNRLSSYTDSWFDSCGSRRVCLKEPSVRIGNTRPKITRLNSEYTDFIEVFFTFKISYCFWYMLECSFF
jgi:hypothetical protein